MLHFSNLQLLIMHLNILLRSGKAFKPYFFLKHSAPECNARSKVSNCVSKSLTRRFYFTSALLQTSGNWQKYTSPKIIKKPMARNMSKTVWALYRIYLENVILKVPQARFEMEVDIFQFDSIRGDWIFFIEKYNSQDDILLDKIKTHSSPVYLARVFSCTYSPTLLQLQWMYEEVSTETSNIDG